MENFLVVIIFIASVIYKIYSNYKKEEEKAKIRRPQQRPTPPIEIKNEPIAKNTSSTFKENPFYSSTTNEKIPDEVEKLMEQKKLTRLKNEIEKKETQKTQEPYQFDLKQAILQNAILERPYK